MLELLFDALPVFVDWFVVDAVAFELLSRGLEKNELVNFESLELVTGVVADVILVGTLDCCCDIPEETFCEIAENAEAAKFALACALEAMLFAFLYWL